MQNDNPSSKEETKREESLTPAQLIKKHMQDPKHVVTDDELKKVKVGNDAEDEKKVSKETNAKKEELDNLPHNDSLPNPYSILGS